MGEPLQVAFKGKCYTPLHTSLLRVSLPQTLAAFIRAREAGGHAL